MYWLADRLRNSFSNETVACLRSYTVKDVVQFAFSVLSDEACTLWVVVIKYSFSPSGLQQLKAVRTRSGDDSESRSAFR